MSLLDDIPEGARLALDTAAFIYFVEAHPQYGPIVRPLFESRLDQGLNEAVTSVVTLAELLVQPLGQGRADLVQRYRDLLTGAPNLTLANITPATAEQAADLRARYGMRLPDAFELAAALEYGAAYFVTNDIRLRRVSELHVVILADYLPASP